MNTLGIQYIQQNRNITKENLVSLDSETRKSIMSAYYHFIEQDKKEQDRFDNAKKKFEDEQLLKLRAVLTEEEYKHLLRLESHSAYLKTVKEQIRDRDSLTPEQYDYLVVHVIPTLHNMLVEMNTTEIHKKFLAKAEKLEMEFIYSQLLIIINYLAKKFPKV